MNTLSSPGAPRDSSLLDDVTWAALAGPQAHLSLGDAEAKRYLPEVAPFAAMRRPNAASAAAMVSRLAAGETIAFSTTEDLGAIPGSAVVVRTILQQMVLQQPVSQRASAVAAITRLSAHDVPEMLALAEPTKPGPFGRRTIEMGDYFGIRVAGALMAMAGERQRIPGFTEISAVCVDPSCRGRGFARELVAHLAEAILVRGETPFLHVLKSNHSAIALYERLGFSIRRELHLAVLRGLS